MEQPDTGQNQRTGQNKTSQTTKLDELETSGFIVIPMFSLEVVDTDDFLDMPTSAQCLYFHLGMRADDDGFVSNPRKITKMANCSQDDLDILIDKKYIIPFESGVVVIRDWKVNNYI